MTKLIPSGTSDCSTLHLEEMENVLVFRLDHQQYGLPLRFVDRVVHVVEFTTLPKSSKKTIGAINLHGLIVPVYNTRQYAGLPSRHITLTDQLIIIRISQQTIALLVDSVVGVMDITKQQDATAQHISPTIQSTDRVLKQGDALIIMFDELERLFGLNKKSNGMAEND